MEIFELMKDKKHEQIAFYTDKSVKLRAILAIHSTALGAALGGIRILKYKNVEEALFDLSRLSTAMTLKSAAAGLNFGGGQIVIIDREGMEKTEALFRALGRFIESFKGRFIAAADIGVTEDSLEFISMETNYVTGLPSYCGGSGNPSYMCAYGTLMGLLASAKYKWGTDDINGKKILIQGYGRIGSYLAGFLKERGANVVISDIDRKMTALAEQKGYEIITMEEKDIYSQKCDIFAPCATGTIINASTIEKFNCEIIAGSANNQLLNEKDDKKLKEKGILYAPDFIINPGGSIGSAHDYLGYKKEKIKKTTEDIYYRLLEIFKTSDQKDISTNEAATQFALKRIDSIKNIRGMYH